MKNQTPKRLVAASALAAVFAVTAPVGADNVGQISTAKRISRQTVVLIDPQGRPGVMPANSDTTVQVGDILTFVIQFTPVPNGATRGLGGYVTDYIPRNTEVVGARLVDKDGNTIAPKRGGYASDGVGPRGDGTFVNATIPAGLDEVQYSFTATWLDADVDGDLDLFVGNGHPDLTTLAVGDPDPDVTDRLHRNEGDGTFTEVAALAGLDLASTTFSATTSDLDRDGVPDLVVSCFKQHNKVFVGRFTSLDGGAQKADVV